MTDIQASTDRLGADAIRYDDDGDTLCSPYTAVDTGVAVLDNGDAELGGPANQGALDSCWARYRTTVLVGVYGALLAIPYVLVKAAMIGIKKDYFGSDETAALVTGLVDCLIATVNLATAPLYGRALDSFGRKPFFVASAALSAVAMLAATLSPTNPVPFMLLVAVSGLIQQSFTGTMLADCYSAADRTRMLGIMYAIQPLGLIFGVILSKVGDALHIGNQGQFLMAAGTCVIGCLLAVLTFRESLPKDKRTVFTVAKANPFANLSVLFKSRVLAYCTAIWCLCGTALAGFGEVWLFYLNERIGFDKSDMQYLLVGDGLMVPFGLVVLLPIFLRKFGTTAVSVGCIVSMAVLMVGVALAWAPWVVFLCLPCAIGVKLLVPIIQMTVANAGDINDLAQRMTALQAVNDLCAAVGPLLFSLGFGLLPQHLMALPFAIASGLVMLSIPLVLWLPAAIKDDAEQRAAGAVAGGSGNWEAVAAIYDTDSAPSLHSSTEKTPLV